MEMKQITILSGRCLVVELPEEAPKPYVINTGQPHLSYLDIDVDFPEIDLPPGNWRIIGMLSEVTESEAVGLVKSIIRLGFFSGNLFKDYESNDFTKETALESLESAILAEGYYIDENPLGNRPEMDASTDDDLDDFDFPNERGRKKWDEGEDKYKKWNEAQSRVLDRSRCLLLGRESN